VTTTTEARTHDEDGKGAIHAKYRIKQALHDGLGPTNFAVSSSGIGPGESAYFTAYVGPAPLMHIKVEISPAPEGEPGT